MPCVDNFGAIVNFCYSFSRIQVTKSDQIDIHIELLAVGQLTVKGDLLQIEEIPFPRSEAELIEAATRLQSLEQMLFLLIRLFPATGSQGIPTQRQLDVRLLPQYQFDVLDFEIHLINNWQKYWNG